ncbi:CaiB/BaiF CoA transferase family protein [Cochlodiniinecator piscidefendens]|uniref:CaiB/BaiF CoA transferase family protein n=1 Tax=Cochlodiniinecator piscidefendens TaxID=2715756 RepID=UPI00140C2EF4|nr:CoA transferase [Cochlodiniinecator piscidefendens]
MKPLDGIRVLDLTHVFAGPFCTYQLGVLGADVIKIEPADQPDMSRIEGADTELNRQQMGLSFQGQSAGKRAMAVDLKSEAGRTIFHKLVQTADVVVQNYTTDCLISLGLDYDTLSTVNPKLIYCSISGFGRSGDKASDPAYDIVVQAFVGAMASNGEIGAPPLRIGPPVVDYGTGAQAAMAVLAALFGRERTGDGRYIDVSMADSALMLMNANAMTAEATGRSVKPHGNRDPSLAGYGAYETADGMLMIGAYTNAQYANLMLALGNSDAAEEIRLTDRAVISQRYDVDVAFLEGVLKEKTADAWEVLLNKHHVPAARVRTMNEALNHPQLSDRSVLQRVEGASHRYTVAGFTFDRGGPSVEALPPRFGQHSLEILEELGIDRVTQEKLLKEGVVAT